MLRVSSLGLIRYHDKSRFLSLRLHRSLSKAVSQTSETGQSHHSTPHEDFDSQKVLHTASLISTNTQTSASAEASEGRRRAIIPPLQFQRKGADEDAQEGTAKRRVTLVANHETSSLSSTPSMPDTLMNPLEHGLLPTGSSLDDVTDVVPPDSLSSPENEGREHFETIMASTASKEEAWGAYEQLVALPTQRSDFPPIPYALLHRLARLLSSTRPRTRILFLQFMSVLATLHNTGGNVYAWEWNALIDMAGKGWRKTRLEDFQASLDVYHDMISHKAPDAHFNRSQYATSLQDPASDRPVVRPDIVTYTTLLNIAGRTLDRAALRHATGILEASGLSPNRITYLATIRHFTRKNELMSVRATLLKMREQGFKLYLDEVNACVWAYARNGRIDVAALMYRILRHRLFPEDEVGEDDIITAVRQLAATEGLMIPINVRPNAATYYILIQCYAYHGDLIRCLNVFMDMMVMEERTAFLRYESLSRDTFVGDGSPVLPAFRAIFLGFARHGKNAEHQILKDAGPLTRRLTASAWTLANLEILFANFLRLPSDAKPSERTIYWVLMAFDTLSGHANWKLRRVWEKLEERFGGGWGGRLERFKTRIYEETKKQ